MLATLLETLQELLSPQNFGWKEVGISVKVWVSVSMTQVQAIKETREFVKCSCKDLVQDVNALMQI